jgi:hypothetical protein
MVRPNVIGGSSNNFVASNVFGATIAGGGSTSGYYGVNSNSVTGDFGTVSGGFANIVSGLSSTVSGGDDNMASLDSATVSGGDHNTASGYGATVNGGEFNTASLDYATVGGGNANGASGYDSTIGGGAFNLAIATRSTVSGGLANIASNIDSTVGGGSHNTASGQDSTVPGGKSNTASGFASFAAGANAAANDYYSFVWSDGAGFSSTSTKQFAVHADGGVRLVGDVTTGDISLSENVAYHKLSMSGGNSTGFLYGAYNYGQQDGIQLGYNFYADNAGTPHIINTGGATSRIIAGYGEIDLIVGGVNSYPNTVQLAATTKGVSVYGTFSNNSDRNAKQDFASVSSAQLLEKVLQLPLSEWSYKVDPTTRHVGPMAQDFHSLFSLGADDKHIAPIDEGGVAFAAIQGLNEKLSQKLEQKETEITELKARLEKLERIVESKQPY